MGYKKLEDNDEEVLEVYDKHKCISKKDFEDLKKNYPNNIKKFKRNGFINQSGKCITNRGKSVFKQHRGSGEYWVMPLKSYNRLRKK